MGILENVSLETCSWNLDGVFVFFVQKISYLCKSFSMLTRKADCWKIDLFQKHIDYAGVFFS